MDARSGDLIEKWQEKGMDYYSKTYTNMWNGQVIPLLFWLKENEKENFKKIYKILFCKDWIKFNLTGEYSTDYTDASNGGLIDLNNGQLNLELFSSYGIDELPDLIPKISKTKETIGYVTENAAARTGLKKGTPVVSGMVDFIACLIGSGLYDESAYSVVSGTWGINMAIRSSLSNTPDIMSTVITPDNDNYIAMEASPNSAVNLEWFLSEVLSKTGSASPDRAKLYEKINIEIEKKDISESGLFYFPFIYKSKLTKKMDGMFYGFNASHDVYDLIRAIYEGVVFSHLMHINNMQTGGINRKKVILSGGATNSDAWCQIFSDILNMEVVVTYGKELGILGLGVYQAVNQKVYKDLEEAISNMVKVKSVYKPNAERHAIYKKRFTEFKRIMKLLDK
jgi:L-xylulokinase